MKPNGILAAALLCALSAISFAKPRKVFILAGQLNMEGQGVVSMDGERNYNGGKGNLVWSMKNSKSADKMECLKNESVKPAGALSEISFTALPGKTYLVAEFEPS